MNEITANINTTIKQAMRQLSQTGLKCLVIVDENYKLLGTLTDGDIRKAILNSIDLKSSIDKIYNSNPKYFDQDKYTLKEV